MKTFLVVTPDESSYHSNSIDAAKAFMPEWDWATTAALINILNVGDEFRSGEVIVVRLSGQVLT